MINSKYDSLQRQTQPNEETKKKNKNNLSIHNQTYFLENKFSCKYYCEINAKKVLKTFIAAKSIKLFFVSFAFDLIDVLKQNFL